MTAEPDTFLPLRPVELQILVSVAVEDLHGYGILQAAEARGEGGAVPGLVTLYRALDRMEERDLIQRASTTGGSESRPALLDERRRTFQITGLGRRVLHAEALRLSALVKAALGALGPGPDEGA